MSNDHSSVHHAQQPNARYARNSHDLTLPGGIRLRSETAANLYGLASQFIQVTAALLAMWMTFQGGAHLFSCAWPHVSRLTVCVDIRTGTDGQCGYLAQSIGTGHDGGMSEKKKDPKKVAAGKAGGVIGGKIGGKSTSEAKQRASRANGKAGGGRPKGIPISTEHAQKAAAGRAASLSPERRREIALKAVTAREAKRQKK